MRRCESLKTMLVSLLALVLFAGLLIYAACSDIASLTIPNWVSLALAGAFPVFAFASGAEATAIGMNFLFGLGVLAVGFLLFQANIIGGGDAKLLAAAAIWTGLGAFTPFAFWTAFAGGAFALLLIVGRKYAGAFAAAPPFVYRLLTPKTGVPYGVAIMIGGLMAAPSMPLFSGALTLP
jgi:prepilin peptidase CpaA